MAILSSNSGDAVCLATCHRDLLVSVSFLTAPIPSGDLYMPATRRPPDSGVRPPEAAERSRRTVHSLVRMYRTRAQLAPRCVGTNQHRGVKSKAVTMYVVSSVMEAIHV